MLSNVRFYVLLTSILISLVVYFLADARIIGEDGTIITVVRSSALLALGYLYITLTLGPATKIFSWLPYRGQLIKSRRGFGVSVFYFGTLHAILAFFNLIGGFTAFFSIPFQYQFPFIFAIIAWFIFLLMALTANDYMMEKLTFSHWKALHRFVYLAAILVLLHATFVGHHFKGDEKLIGYLFYLGAGFLVSLHIYGLYLKSRKGANGEV